MRRHVAYGFFGRDSLTALRPFRKAVALPSLRYHENAVPATVVQMGVATFRRERSGVPLSVVEWALHRCPPFIGARTIPTTLRLAGAKVAWSALFWGMPKLTGEGKFASRLEIGDLCGLNFGCYFELDASITLADNVAVGHEVMFLTRVRDSEDAAQRGRVSGAKPIVIEPGCWLGSRSTIMPGVTVGAGSVVGANVVVREDLPPNTLLAGTRKISIAKWRK
jgi:acetyltransferase-like isoleucine patch superfamily enzyme